MRRRLPDWVTAHPRASGATVVAAALLYLWLLVQLPRSLAVFGAVGIGVAASLAMMVFGPRRGRRRGAPPHEIGDA